MKASINRGGVITISPEDEMEAYALKKWMEESWSISRGAWEGRCLIVNASIDEEEKKAVAHVERNSAGQIFLVGENNEHFDMSKYVGETLFIMKESNK